MKRAKKVKTVKNKLDTLLRNIRLAVFDFDGVFTDNRVLVLEDGKEAVFCLRSDGFGISALKKIGVLPLVISTEINPVVSVRCRKLDIHCIHGCINKLEALKDEAVKLGIPLDEVAYLGNDVNDIECLKAVGVPACVCDAYPEVRRACRYITKIPGGKGAVREFCDLIVRAKNE